MSITHLFFQIHLIAFQRNINGNINGAKIDEKSAVKKEGFFTLLWQYGQISAA